MTVHFTPAGAGGWQALCAGPRLLVLGAAVSPERLEALWSAVGDPSGFQTVLDVLTSEGLSATPPFALLDGEGADLRTVLRGEVTATVITAQGEQSLNGAGVSTWVEQRIGEVTSASLTIAGAAVIGEAGRLPLRDGAAWIAGVDFTPGGAVPALPRPKSAKSAVSAKKPAAASGPKVAAVKPASAPKAEPATAASTAAPKAGPVPVPEPSPESTAEVSEATVTDVVGLPPAAEETAFRVSEAAASAPVPAEPVPEGDHDGQTVMTSDIAKLRAGRRSPKSSAAVAPKPAVPALYLSVSTGEREPLDQPILVGRAPSVSKVSGDQIPRLLRVGSADQDISRNHARIALEGDTVVVTDLHSRNGTMIVLPGKEAQKLRAGEPTSVIVGTVVDLGGGVTLTVDED